MKIYKSTLAQFLNEAKPPFYLSSSQAILPGKLPQSYWFVALSGRNSEGEWCEFFLRTIDVYQFDGNAVKLMANQAEIWKKELRTRLEALELEIRDGRVSESEPMVGMIE